jgi:hypothetical protein
MLARLLTSGARWLLEEALEWCTAVILLIAVGVIVGIGSWPLAVVLLPLAVIGILVGHWTVAVRLRKPPAKSDR